MNCRLATVDDINNIYRIDTVATDTRLSEITHWVKQDHCFVLEENEQIFAYGVITPQFFAHGFIELLMVNNLYRRQGLGLLLIKQLIKRSPTTKVFTSTNQSNTATQQLFVKAGFIPSGSIENLDDHDPELIYCYIPS
ncbi:GNAT family N-acetyltransferase [Providencia sp. R33]|uniref:GNAT family N-acetyltransferase n=1 Tax=Providencia TaxID=586 RepID=UPI001C5AA083|nr:MULTISPECIES: GNAT family N-acetyltransferase [Providencia]QXX83712.1 GNAT family N-acetyltransferase [Providencia sp. R33]